MMEKKDLTEEEQKAKEYVDFYYFWLFHYCARNYSRELRNRLPPDEFEHHEIRQSIAQGIYWGHPLSSMYPQYSSAYDKYTQTDDLLSGSESMVTEDEPSTLLQRLFDGEKIERLPERNVDYGMRVLGTNGAHISSDGHLLGTIIAEIDLRVPNSVILYELSKLRESKFDAFPNFMDAPVLYGLEGSYTQQREIIRQSTNSSFAVKDDAARAIGLWLWDAIEGPRAIFKSFAEAWKVITREYVSDILVEDDIPRPEREGYEPYEAQDGRSCGTCARLYDQYEDNADHPCTTCGSDDTLPNWVWEGDVKANPITVQGVQAIIETGTDVEPEIDVFFTVARRGEMGNWWHIPSLKIFTKLGYSVSDPSVFRRLYRNTKRCIDACEVLSLKD